MPTLLETPASGGSLEARLRTVFRLLLGGLVLVAAAGVVSALALEGAARDIDSVQGALQMSSRIREGMIEQETGVRGFILTERADFLESFPRGGSAVDEQLAQLREVATTIDALEPLLSELEESITAWREIADDEIELVRTGRMDDATAIVASGVPKERFDVVRERSGELDDFLARLVESRTTRQNALERLLAVAGAIVAIGGILLVTWTHRWLVRSVTRPLAVLTGAVGRGGESPFETLAGGGAAGEVAALARSADQLRSTKDLERHEAVVAATHVERQRIASDLHDGPLQTLFGLQLQLRQLRDRLRADHDLEGAGVAGRGVDVLEATQTQLRGMLFDLAPPGLGDKSFVDVVVDTVPHLLDPPATLTVDGRHDIELQASTQYLLYRVIVEAIRNVNKHAAASTVDISVAATADGVSVAIVDDGVGFEPTLPVTGPHFGLDIMRSLVGSVDGRIEISSAPMGGTTVHVVVPG